MTGSQVGEAAKERIPPREKPPIFPVVGIGASAGGIEAFRKFFPHVAADCGMAFVVVQHLSPKHESNLAEFLGRLTSLPVAQIADHLVVEPNHVYVIPPDAALTIKDGRLRLSGPVKHSGYRHAIDTFLISLAKEQGERAACVILSGTGSDGTVGLKAIKEHGGLTLAQAGASAAYDGMMRSAVATGLVDFVLAPEEMPARLVDYFRHLVQVDGKKGPDGLRAEATDHLGQICALLRARTGHDFSSYKDKTVVRRVQRRMQVMQIDEVPDFIERLRKEPREVDLLFQDLLIGVTHFFRDPEAFEALEKGVVPSLFEGKGSDDTIRVWVPGCATGEEAYSIAMLLREQLPKGRGAPKLQIFASDIDEPALEVARAGRYPATIAQDVPPRRLRRFFLREDGTYRVIGDLRETCLFSRHNLLRDAPFSRLDLISCRNLLIYLNAKLQDRIIPLFHYALRDGGYLFLGASENVSRHTRLFTTVDKTHRIFKRRPQLGRPLPQFPLSTVEVPRRQPAREPAAPAQRSLIQRAEQLILDEHAPAHVIINRDGDVILFSGRTGKYLEPAAGAPDRSIYGMARPGLRPTLRAAVHRAVTTGRAAVQRDVSVAVNGGSQTINLVVQPMHDGGPESEFYLVVFQDVGAIRHEAAEPVETVRDVESATVRQLEMELRETRERLQATTEELEASNEELKSSNEELSSMNEELQSANEELETSKEELQSINEELYTVNAELNARVEELGQVNSDISNLLESTQIATVFLGRDLNVKSFTPAAKEVFRLVESDVGRPLSHVRTRFALDTLEQDAERVLRTLSTVERQVDGADTGTRYIMRMLPYRSVDNVIGGIVLTFTDVSEITRAEARIQELNRDLRNHVGELEALLNLLPVAIFMAEDPQARRVRTNRYGARLVGQDAERATMELTPSQLRLGVGDREVPLLDQPLQRAARKGEAVSAFEGRLSRADGAEVAVMISATPLFDEEGRSRGAIAVLVDISQRKHAELQQNILLHELQHRVKNILATVASLATRMVRSSASLEEFSAAFLARLSAMGSTHDLMSRSRWEGADLRALVATTLAPYASGDLANVVLTGPEVQLRPNAAATIGMILHELATNAAKYGALSAVGGRVEVSWTLLPPDGVDRLTLVWGESGGPRPQPPAKLGFGVSFMKRSVEYELQGSVELTFEPSGLRCKIEFPLRNNADHRSAGESDAGRNGQ